MRHRDVTRRTVLRAWLVLPAAYALAACTGQAASTATSAPTRAAQATSTTPPPSQAAQSTTAPPAAPAATGVPASAPAVASPTATRVVAASATPVPSAQAAALTPTPQCGDDDDDPTPAQTEGPYYTPNTPERASLLEPGMAGTKLTVSGRVLSTACAPVGRALLDFWQADDAGQYDNAGFRLRGHLFTDAQGRYTLETIMPGLYPGRTRHIHVKVQAPNRPVLTTQLYFPGEAANARDGIFRQELVMAMRDVSGGKAATFDFVLDLG